MHRLFVAIDLPDAVKDQLAQLCSGVSGARWVGRDQMHLTLRFIGERDDEQYEAIKSILDDILASHLDIRLNGLGQFPPKGNPRVLWVGVKAPPGLNELQQKVESTLQAIGVPVEERPFSPHITLARFKTPPSPESLRQYFARNGDFATELISISEFILYSSRLSPQGASYTHEAVYRLK